MTSPELSISEAGRRLLSMKIEPKALDLLCEKLLLTRFGVYLIQRRRKKEWEFLEEPEAVWTKTSVSTIYIRVPMFYPRVVGCLFSALGSLDIMLHADTLEEVLTSLLFGQSGLKEAQDRVGKICLEYHRDPKGVHNED